MKEKIDFSSDIGVLIAQLKRLAATKLGKQLGIGPLVFVDPELAQALVDVDNAVRRYEPDLKDEWEQLKRRVIRKAAIIGVRELSEQSMLFIAAADNKRDDYWDEGEY